MKKWQLFGTALLAGTALFVSGSFVMAAENKDSKTASVDEGKKAFEEKCGQCHKIDKAQKYTGKAAWDGIVKRMAKKKDANITDDAATKIIAYLDKTYPKK